MAEEIDLHSNLCTTEEAFEEFQANSMYEEREDEYITLADIVPEQAPQPNFPDAVNYFSEQAVSSSFHNQDHDVNKQLELSEEQHRGNDLTHTYSDCNDDPILNNEKQASNSINSTKTNKRGRKKKNISNNHGVTLSNTNETQDLISVSVSATKKRGRKRKSALNISEKVCCNIDNSTNEKLKATESKGRRKNSKEKPSTLTTKAENLRNSRIKNTGKPRSRQRITTTENNVANDTVTCENILSHSCQPEEDDIDNMSLSKLKGIKVLTIVNEEEDVINRGNVTSLEMKPQPTDSSKIEHFESKIDSSVIEFNSEKDNETEKSGIADLLTSPSHHVTDLSLEDSFNCAEKSVHSGILEKVATVESLANNSVKGENYDKEGDRNVIENDGINNDEDIDDISLSKLKATLENESSEEKIMTGALNKEEQLNKGTNISTKRNSKMPVMSDFEYNIDKVVNETLQNEKQDKSISEDLPDESLLIEDTSKRPVRRKVHKTLLYNEESDEDPFANVELSDEEPRKRRGNRYYSDDEYIPGRKDERDDVSDLSDSSADEDLESIKKQKRKKYQKKSDNSQNKSPRKRTKKSDTCDEKDIWRFSPDVTTLTPDENKINDDIEICLETSVIRTSDDAFKKQPSQNWGTTNEFENFLAKKIQGTALKIKKVSSTEAFENVIAPLDIPVINPNEAKKSIEMCTQTANVPTESTAVQTTDPYVTTMKDNVKLTPEVSKHACEFLKSIVKTTAELGQLMTQKSEDFINKKINSDHITDTFKMDYCVKKSFLLFKLAKSNIVQMEEDLAKQYDEFLRSNNLLSCREEEKKVTPTSKTDGDSDCEIVEVSTQSTNIKKEEKPKFNPKTVFLNKELSIKIAKKTNQDDKKKEKLNIKGRHTIWINDSVMVKKVKPSQSFLAQDSRNKKPPDTYVTTQAVSEFFKNYFRQKALSICAPFVSPETLSVKEIYACNYFFKSDDILKHSTGNNTNISHLNNNHVKIQIELKSPRTLFSICTSVLQKHLYKSSNGICLQTVRNKPEKIESLFRLCVNVLCNYHKIDYYNDFKISSLGSSQSSQSVQYNGNEKLFNVSSLKTICFKNIVELFYAIKSHRHLPKELAHITKYSRNTECNNNKKIGSENQEIVLTNKVIYVPKTLLSICLETQHSILKYSRSNEFDNNNKKTGSENQEIVMTNKVIYVPKTLLSICLETQHSILEYSRSNECNNNKKTGSKNQEIVLTDKVIYVPKTLLSICLEIIHNEQKHATSVERNVSSNIYFPQSLKNIAYQNIIKIIYENLYSNNHNTEIIQEKSVITTQKAKTLADICYDFISKYFRDDNLCNINENRDAAPISLTINSVNTLSEEAYLTIGQSNNSHFEDETDFYNDDDDDDYDMGYNDFHYDNQTTTECSNWASQVQMKELRSCTTPLSPDISRNHIITNEKETTFENHTITAQIKIEPDEEPITVLDTVNIKVEPDPNLDEMTVIPDSVVTKMEKPDCSNAVKSSVTNDNALSFDENMFEHFVSRNKMMNEILMNEDGLPGEEIYSQSALRIRRQHQPDSDEDNDACESLLIPQGFEPLRAENAKDYLMGSSSNDEGSKKTEKRKPERRTKKSNKKGEANKQNSKQVLTSLQEKPSNAEVAELTKRMRDKIRHEERKEHSSDSETEHSINLRNMKDARKKKKDQQKSKTKKNGNDEIQCNNVDSTEQSILEQDENSFTGFSAVDQNEISSYQKYVKYVYDKIMPPESQNEESIAKKNVETESKKCEDKNDKDTPLINFDEPAEILECEPSMPIFDECSEDNSKVSDNKTTKLVTNMSMQKNEQDNSTVIDTLNFVDRYGWSCYPIDKNDMRLYQIAHIPLEKLPDSFVETYFKYQDVSDRKKEDEEVDRLTNLQTLHRTSLIREGKVNKNKELKSKTADDKQTESLKSSNTNSRANSPANYDNYDELTPSEDEAKVEDEIPPPMRPKQSENNLAKNSLMNDNDSDSDIPLTERMIKNEQEENDSITKKYKPGPKCSKQKEHSQVGSGELILTADKMMNKELTMLHAPVILTDSKKNEDTNENSNKGMLTRNKQKSLINKTHDIKHEDNSSSEEEKQWVNTKEKLLKRLEKRQENTSLDDAKRNKIVSDFIEKHGAEKHEIRKGRGRGRRSKKKLLERQKQIRVLSNELYGESSTHTGSRFSQSYFKGRRNIRKVIDKKSLARSTVVANMEEFERKRRLNQRQSKLRELLGCEEGVNVLVINDEVCLDYDFKEMQPIVAVHRFFTTVMKAHQYEGVKFMWDACFESLEMVESGHPGGGCILAHCMGLGKTLQVLALLHTVLTHPRVGMHRVLVCCPLSTVLNWVDEIHKWIGPVTNQIKVFELSKLKKTYERAYQLEDWYKGGGIFIIGYELFRSLTTLDPELDQVKQTTVNKIRTALLDPGPDIIVCDEGHLLKNDSSVLAVAMSRVVTKRRIVLTGTPMQNNLREYYCMVNFVKPNLLGTYSEYSNRFENPIMNGQHRDSREEDIKLMKARTHILHKVLEGCLQRQEASVLYPYLPKKHEYTVFISMTQCQWDLYKHYMNTYAKKSKQSVLKDFHILQKIWSHPQSLHNFQVKSRDENSIKIKAEKLEDDLAKEDLAASEDIKPLDTEVWWLQYLDSGKMLESLESSNKFVVLFRILDECVAIGDKVLIFSTSLITMDSLEYFLKNIKKWNLGTEYYRLDGSVPAEVRQKWCREFNAENNQKTKLFLISTRAGSLGLNMVAANRVIILDTSWNPAHDIQSIFRVYRFGQKKDCYIYRLVAMGTMEQKIYERSVTKQAVSCRVVDAQQIDRHYNMAELTELYRYDESGSCVAGGVAGGVRDAALLRVARLAALHAVHEHDSLLRGSTEQGLPEHERTAAWLQFQLEHDHKQNQMYGNMTVPVKRPHGHDYTKFVNEEDIIPKLEATSTPEAEPKAKRGRKNSTVNCNIPVNDQTTQDPVTYKLEEDKFIQKIINFLFKHNLHKTYNLKEINEMVSNLRMMCQNGQITVDDGELSHEIIIKVLRELKKKRSMPALTNVTNPGKKRARSRRQSTEYTPSTSCVVQQDNSENFQGRLKRKAALEAEKYMNTFKNDLSNNDGDIHKDSDTDTASENESLLVRMNEKKKKYNKKNTLEGTAISDNIPAKKPFVVKELVAAKEPEKLSSNDYILLLSDEDENNTEKPKSNPIEGSNQNTASYPIDNTDETRDEKIPLHPSLLKNQNFIKIVAHSYLSNNPFLDEDAAFLAAQYSTSKALKEVESIGNEICSGPIYDIAIKVLGRAILEKLHKSKLQPKGTLGASLNEQSNFARNENIKAYKANKTTTEKSSSNLLPTPTTSTVTSLTTTNKLNETTELTAQSSSKSSLSSTPSTSTETSQSTRHATNETIKLTEKSSSKSLLLSTPNKSTVKSRTTRHKSNEAMKLTEESSSKTSLSSTPITSTVTSHTTRHKSNETINLTEESSSKLSSIPSTSTVTPKTGRHRSHEAKNLIEESSSSLLLSTVTTSTITPLPTTNKSNETRRLAVKKSSELLFTSTPAISTVTSGTATPKVVPVGLIKRVVNIPPQNKSSQNVGDECILPDDDDIHLVNDATPTLAPPSVQHRPGPKSVVEKRKAIVLNKVIAQKGAPKFIEQNAFRIRRSSTQINSITNTPRVYRDSASKNQLASTQSAPLRVTAGNSEQPSIAKTINKKPVIDGNTICLDSDDDDIPINTKDLSLNDTSQTIPQVIPVTLTAVNPNAAMMMMNANSLETSTPQVLPIPSSLVSVPNRQPMIQVDGTQISTSTNILSDVDNTINTPISTSNSAPIAPPKILTRVSTVPHNITPIALPPQSQAAQVITSSPSQSIKLPLISTTSEKPPNKVGSAKIKTTRTICKPGDIIRINKDGNFEVLDKIDANFKFVNSTNNSECQQETSTTDKKTSNNDRPESKQNESNLPTEHVLNVYSSSGSSSDSSRPSSPDDPLAILKDVVKIVPADYNETKTAANTSNDNTFKSKTSSKPNVSTNKPSNNKPTIVGRSITDPSNVLRHKNTKEARNFSNPKFKNPKQNIKTQQNKSLRNVTGDNSKVVSLVDLTGSISAPKTSSKALDKPQIKATINLTDLTLNEDNAAVPKSTQRTNTQSQPKVIRVTCVDKLDPKPSTSASTSEVTKVLTIPAKKRRIDQMTLKDFDIDDIDDIIELE